MIYKPSHPSQWQKYQASLQKAARRKQFLKTLPAILSITALGATAVVIIIFLGIWLWGLLSQSGPDAPLSNKQADQHAAPSAGRYLKSAIQGLAKNSAKLAMAAFQRMYAAGREAGDPPEALSFEGRQMAKIADLITRRWPGTPDAAEAFNGLIDFALREKRIGEQFESQIETAHSTYKVIEDSGLFSLKEMMAMKPEDDVEKASAKSFLASAKEQISGGQATNEALKKLRDKSALLMAQNQDEEILKGVIRILRSLI